MNPNTQKRILADALLILTFFWLPWWSALILAVILFFFFTDFIELIIVGVATDLLYGGAGIFGGFSSPFFMSIASALIYLILILVKRRLR